MCDPHKQAACNHTEEERSCNRKSCKIGYIIQIYTQAMPIKMNNDKDNMFKDDQSNIQAIESTHQVKRHTMMSLYM